jgi:hypothetical protein
MFKRGISFEFVEALRRLAKEEGPNWWTEVLADDDLFIAVRDEKLDVYRRGQALFQVFCTPAGVVYADTHPKYLLDPDMGKRVAFDGSSFELPASAALMDRWVPGVTLDKMKRAAKLFAEREKTAVHAVVRQNPDVLDVEIAVRRAKGQEGRELPRIDLLHLEDDGAQVRLVFWEVKLFSNGEIRAEGGAKAKVVGQLDDYQEVLETERANILKSYRQVAANLVAIAEMRPSGRSAGKLIEKVAAAPDMLTLGVPPDVKLLVTGFDKDQLKGTVWEVYRKALHRDLGTDRVALFGSAATVRLSRRRSA